MASKDTSNSAVVAGGVLGLAELGAKQEFHLSQIRASLEKKNEKNGRQCLGLDPIFFC